MPKIDAPPKHSHHLSLWLGLVAAILIALASIIFTHAHEEKKRHEVFNWKKPLPSDVDLRARLTEEQYRLTHQNATETLFHNLYWDNQKPGIYVDIISGEPLFSSTDKYDGGLGLPTFSKPIEPGHVAEVPDNSHEMQRTELRASHSNSHLGHVFPDPKSPTGRRYLVNSAALHFIPVDQLDDEGYAQYVKLFPNKG